ncbi:hypothetical protein EU527_07880 [Candidatus Thorarchaeota archaeon]|nr:MAG: hypothetical protein EU527_07880 [Candidatus Thorarchaeota archaeon]
MRETNVLFIWDVREELQNYLHQGLKEVEGVNLLFPKDVSEESLHQLAPRADILVGWRPSRELLDTAVRFQLFINPGVGVQHLIGTFRELSKDRDVILINGHGNTYFTAQQAIAMLLALTNKIILHHTWMKEGLWRRGDDFAKSTPLRELKIGLLGYGAVNRKVHKFLSGFEIEFLILKRSRGGRRKLPTKAKLYTPDELEKFLKEVDILFVAVPQTEETMGMIGKKELELLGENGIVVNIARGIVIDEEALFEALSKNIIAGAAIDVWYDYNPEPDSEGRRFPTRFPFHSLDNVVLSPHRGASPTDDLKRWDEVIVNIRKFAEEQYDFINIVQLDRGY